MDRMMKKGSVKEPNDKDDGDETVSNFANEYDFTVGYDNIIGDEIDSVTNGMVEENDGDIGIEDVARQLSAFEEASQRLLGPSSSVAMPQSQSEPISNTSTLLVPSQCLIEHEDDDEEDTVASTTIANVSETHDHFDEVRVSQMIQHKCAELGIPPSSPKSRALAINLIYQKRLKDELRVIATTRARLFEEEATLSNNGKFEATSSGTNRSTAMITGSFSQTLDNYSLNHDDVEEDSVLHSHLDAKLYRSQQGLDDTFGGDQDKGNDEDEGAMGNAEGDDEDTTNRRNMIISRSFFQVSSVGSPPPRHFEFEEAHAAFNRALAYYNEPYWAKPEIKALKASVLKEVQRVLRERIHAQPNYGFIGELARKEYSKEHLRLLKVKSQELVKVGNMSLKEALQKVGTESEDLNWSLVKIGVEGKSSEDCRVRWVFNDSPLVNKLRWKKEEDLQLLCLVTQNPQQSWSWYSQQLSTNRSATACLQRFQRSLNSTMQKKKWTEEEDEQLTRSVYFHGDKHWLAISRDMDGRDPSQCMNRWNKTLNPAIRRAKWNAEEDRQLSAAVKKYGKQWTKVQRLVKGRTDMQCRERYCNVLEQRYSFEWTEEADNILLDSVKRNGKKWCVIASELANKHSIHQTDNRCLRRWAILCPSEYKEHLEQTRKAKMLLMTNFSGSEKRQLSKTDLSLEDVSTFMASLSLAILLWFWWR
eukprot:m.71709 g.71709  ORF g.71709 m.71709 type:complete len:702 (+) comp8361_c1_seq3:176-2281(+)